MRKFLQIAICFTVLVIANGCSKEEVSNNIPYTRVEFNFYPRNSNSTDYVLLSYGGIKKFNGQGYNKNGVFVGQFSLTDEDLFMAFDATCPLEEETGFKTAVTIDEGSILKLKCPKCGTVFDLKNEGRGGGTRLSRYAVKSMGYKTYYRVHN